MSILPKAIYRFNSISIKIPMAFFTELEKEILKIFEKYKRPQITKTILRKKNKAVVIMLPDFKWYCKATIIKNSTILTQIQIHRPIERTATPAMNSHLWQLIDDKRGKSIQWGKDSLFDERGWKNCSYMQKN